MPVGICGVPRGRYVLSFTRGTVPFLHSDLRAGQCEMSTIMQLGSASDKTAFVMGLLTTNAPCGVCIMGCASATDQTACVMGCTGGGSGANGTPAVTPCEISDVMGLASGDARMKIVEMFYTKPICASCLRTTAAIDTQQIMPVCAMGKDVQDECNTSGDEVTNCMNTCAPCMFSTSSAPFLPSGESCATCRIKCANVPEKCLARAFRDAFDLSAFQMHRSIIGRYR